MNDSIDWPLIVSSLKASGMTVREISHDSRLPRSVINALAHGYVGLYPDYADRLLDLYRGLTVKKGG
ncbi:hypothetical protein J9Z47_003544 [Salmonella enterica]|nr:hypothetical protein [Salmonella enterica]